MILEKMSARHDDIVLGRISSTVQSDVLPIMRTAGGLSREHVDQRVFSL